MTQLPLRALVIGCALCLACIAPKSSVSPAAAGKRSEGERFEVAVVPFGFASSGSPPPHDVAGIIRADLESLGRYALVPVAELPSRPTRLSEVVFTTWRTSQVDYLVVGLVAGVHDGGHEVEFRLIDPHEETTLVGYLVPSAPDALEQTAHRIADLIASRIAASPSVAREHGSRHASARPDLRSPGPHEP